MVSEASQCLDCEAYSNEVIIDLSQRQATKGEWNEIEVAHCEGFLDEGGGILRTARIPRIYTLRTVVPLTDSKFAAACPRQFASSCTTWHWQ